MRYAHAALASQLADLRFRTVPARTRLRYWLNPPRPPVTFRAVAARFGRVAGGLYVSLMLPIQVAAALGGA